MKKLIPALCMLLVAACLMGTSTYAWFAANESVTASGMQVKAASDGGLAIASYVAYGTAPGASEFGSTATAKWSNAMKTTTNDDGDEVVTYVANVSPTSFDGTNWWTAEAAVAESAAAKTGSYDTVDLDWDTGKAGAGIFQHTKWQIKSLAEGENLPLKVIGVQVTNNNTSGTNAQLEKSLRVVIKCGTSYFEFAPLYDAASAQEQLYYNGTAAVQNKALYFGNNVNNNVTIGTVSSSTPTDVEVFVYFEGEDTNCKTNNIDINTLKNLSVTITYSAKAAASGS